MWLELPSRYRIRRMWYFSIFTRQVSQWATISHSNYHKEFWVYYTCMLSNLQHLQVDYKLSIAMETAVNWSTVAGHVILSLTILHLLQSTSSLMHPHNFSHKVGEVMYTHVSSVLSCGALVHTVCACVSQSWHPKNAWHTLCMCPYIMIVCGSDNKCGSFLDLWEKRISYGVCFTSWTACLYCHIKMTGDIVKISAFYHKPGENGRDFQEWFRTGTMLRLIMKKSLTRTGRSSYRERDFFLVHTPSYVIRARVNERNAFACSPHLPLRTWHSVIASLVPRFSTRAKLRGATLDPCIFAWSRAWGRG